MAWTLEGELERLAWEHGTTASLRSLGLLGADETLDAVATIEDWHRSGEETYSLIFAVEGSAGRRVCVMKACVAYNWLQSLTEIFADWMDRRALVDSLGVGTPKLYGRSSALLVEEHIPYPLADGLAEGDRNSILRSVGQTAALLVNTGFVPLRSTDWRTRGNDVVLVDFGTDLGSPWTSDPSTEVGLLSEVLDNLARAGAGLTPDELQIVGKVYEELLEVRG